MASRKGVRKVVPSRYRRVVFPVLLLIVVLLLASTLSSVLSPVLLAMLLAVILNPLAVLAERFSLPRVVSVPALYLVMIVLVAMTASGVGGQFGALAQSLSGETVIGDLNGNGVYDAGALSELAGWVDQNMKARDGEWYGELIAEARATTLEGLARVAQPAGEMLSGVLRRLATWVGGVAELVTMLILVPFYLFFFLVEYPVMRRRLQDLIPQRYREQVDRITKDIGHELVTFLRGRLLCGLVKGAILWVGLSLLNIPFALPISLLSGLLSLVPFLGFLAGVLPAAVLGLTMPGGGAETVGWVVGVFLGGEAFEGAVLFPLILGRETGLHPVMIVALLLAGGALMGSIGVIVALPLALVCKVLWRELGRPLYLEWAEADTQSSGTKPKRKRKARSS